MTIGNDYNRRLFSGGLRKKLHEARFHWLHRETAGLSGSVIEIGCFNARSLDYISFEHDVYLGLDAGWEGGLDEAKENFPQHSFKKSTDPSDIAGMWGIAIALETLEHLPRPEVLEAYLEKLALQARLLLATVPMEIGPLFAAKFMYKKFVHRYPSKHSLPEFFNQTLGRCDRIIQDNHRGFDYRRLLGSIEKHFVLQKVEGINSMLPKIMNTQIGIRATSRYV